MVILLQYMTGETRICIDLDNTLIETHSDYIDAKEKVCELVCKQTEFSIDEIRNKCEELDERNLEKYGLDADRFPRTLRDTVSELIEDPSKDELRKAEQIGYNTYKSASEYQNRGFMNGAKQMLQRAFELSDELHLVTVGDPTVQLPKVEALKLNQYFTEIHVCSYEDGKEPVFTELNPSSNTVIHFGDSAKSDIQAILNSNGFGVYIGEESDWLSNTYQTKSILESPNAFVYENHQNLVANFETQIQYIESKSE